MPIDHFINRKSLLNTDTKPSPSYLKDLIVHETDTGDTYTSDGTTTSRIQSQNSMSETLINKELDFSTNQYDLAILDNPFSGLRKGGAVPAATISDSFYGIIEGAQLHNPDMIGVSNLLGIIMVFTGEVDDGKLGFSSNTPIARRADGYTIKGEFQNTMNDYMLIGFSTSQYFSLYDNVFFNNDVGIAIGYTPTTSNYSMFVNDGSGTPATPASFTVVKDKLLHTIEIILEPTQITCKLDNETIIATTKLPALNADLYLNVYGVY